MRKLIPILTPLAIVLMTAAGFARPQDARCDGVTKLLARMPDKLLVSVDSDRRERD
jgi:hypothetical protein